MYMLVFVDKLALQRNLFNNLSSLFLSLSQLFLFSFVLYHFKCLNNVKFTSFVRLRSKQLRTVYEFYDDNFLWTGLDLAAIAHSYWLELGFYGCFSFF